MQTMLHFSVFIINVLAQTFLLEVNALNCVLRCVTYAFGNQKHALCGSSVVFYFYSELDHVLSEERSFCIFRFYSPCLMAQREWLTTSSLYFWDIPKLTLVCCWCIWIQIMHLTEAFQRLKAQCIILWIAANWMLIFGTNCVLFCS